MKKFLKIYLALVVISTIFMKLNTGYVGYFTYKTQKALNYRHTYKTTIKAVE